MNKLKPKKYRNTTYASEIAKVDFSKLSKHWKQPQTELPPTTSYMQVLIIGEKHGKDVVVYPAHWMPYDRYTKGKFHLNTRHTNEISLDRIYFWRPLNFLKEVI